MAANLGEIRTKVVGDGTGGRLHDEARELDSSGTTNVDIAIASAVSEYGRARPLDKAIKLTGAGSFDFAISSLTGYVDGGSSITQVIYPYVATTQRHTTLDPESYVLIRLDTGLFLRLLDATPAVGEFVLVNFTAPHTLSAGASTIPSTDDEALADLATAHACQMLADRFSQSTSTSLSGDSVDHLSKADEYRQNAAKWRKAYELKMGIGGAGSVAACGTVVELDRAFMNQGRTGLFFHGQRGA